MNDRLVCKCILVLRLLSKDDKHVNLLIEETGLYKNYVFEAVKTLQKAQLVKERKTSSHKQKKIQQLTEFGGQVVKFILYIEEINRSYSGLKNTLIQNFSMAEDLGEIQMKNRLRSKGWSSKEIEFYPEFARYASLLTTESLSMIYDVFMYRYFSLLLEYEIKRDAKIILNKIVVDALEYHMSTTGDILTKRMSHHMKDNNDKRDHILLDELL